MTMTVRANGEDGRALATLVLDGRDEALPPGSTWHGTSPLAPGPVESDVLFETELVSPAGPPVRMGLGRELVVTAAVSARLAAVGRTGEAEPLDAEGSFLDIHAITTAVLAWGTEVYRSRAGASGSVVAIGGSVSLSWGHMRILARYDGTESNVMPPEVEVRFPTLHSRPRPAGRGIGVSLAGSWNRGPTTLSLVLDDVVQSFRWRESAFAYRAGEAHFSDDFYRADNRRRPAEDAPPALRAELTGRALPCRARLNIATRLSERVELASEVGRGSLTARPGETPLRAGVGTRIETTLPGDPIVLAGLGAEGGSLDLSAGLAFQAGRVLLSAALAGRPGGRRRGLGGSWAGTLTPSS